MSYKVKTKLAGKSALIVPRSEREHFGNDFIPRSAREQTLITSGKQSLVNSSPFQHDGPTTCLLSPRSCPFGGACHACPLGAQAKLTVSRPGDRHEQEADRVADAVMRMPAPRADDEDERVQAKPLAAQISPLVQRQPTNEDDDDEPVRSLATPGRVQRQVEADEQDDEQLQRKPTPRRDEDKDQLQRQPEDTDDEQVQAKPQPGALPMVTPNLAGHIQALRGGGQPLPASERAFFEPRFGHDFGGVRVHTGSAAGQLARAVQARAFTLGRDVVFGAGQYAPGSHAGRQLLAHELTHVVQQGHTQAVQRKQNEPPASNEVALAKLGARLWQDFPTGITVGFYDKNEPVAVTAARDWALREQALGPVDKNLTATTITFGKAFPDSFSLTTTISKLGDILKAAIDTQSTSDHTPVPGTGPAQIRVLALFGHATSDWCGIGSGINKSQARNLIRTIAPNLTKDVKIVMYACSTGRDPEEIGEDYAGWYSGTMQPGGARSLSGTLRDAMIEQGLAQGEVWGHTTKGHVSHNFALRVFSAALGKGTVGSAYAGEQVFDGMATLASLDVIDDIERQGIIIPTKSHSALSAVLEKKLGAHFYRCYAQANRNLKYRSATLAEMAPLYPQEVAEQIRSYWEKVYWPKNRASLVKQLINRFKLKPAPTTKALPAKR